MPADRLHAGSGAHLGPPAALCGDQPIVSVTIPCGNKPLSSSVLARTCARACPGVAPKYLRGRERFPQRALPKCAVFGLTWRSARDAEGQLDGVRYFVLRLTRHNAEVAALNAEVGADD